jgi:hypothetical protein
MRLAGVILVVATWMSFHSFKAEAATGWSANGASCVPVETVGVHIAGGAVTAGAGVTITLYCQIANVLAGAVREIEITYKGGVARKVFTTSELVEMSKATGVETIKCAVQSTHSATITTKSSLCNDGHLDFNNNFYYVRIVLKSGSTIGKLQTLYGSSLTSGDL